MNIDSQTASVAVLDQLTVRYGRTTALDRVSLAVERGSVYALLGRNGAGKSSALRCLLGQQRPSGGRTRLFDLDTWRHRRLAMVRTGVVPEDPDGPPEMTAVALSAFFQRIYERWDSAAVASRLARFGVPTSVPFARLSKGQKGQVSLALALGHSPDLLILDDPTLGLDAVARIEFFEELVADLADRGTTVLVTTHDLAGVERIATRVGILCGGTLVLDEDLETVKSRFRHLRFRRQESAVATPVAARLSEFQIVGLREREWGTEAVLTNYDDRVFERFRADGDVSDAEVAPMSLEQIFAAIAAAPQGEPA